MKEITLSISLFLVLCSCRSHDMPNRFFVDTHKSLQGENSKLLAMESKSPSKYSSSRGTNVVFWVGANSNEFFDDQINKFIVKNTDLMVLRTPQLGYKTVVQKIHRIDPNFSVLMYSFPLSFNPKSKAIESATLSGFERLDPKNILTKNQRFIYGDITQLSFRDWLVNKTQAAISESNADGVAFDSTYYSPEWFLPKACDSGDYCKNYANSLQQLLLDIKKSISPKLVIYNGLWSDLKRAKGGGQVKLQDQVKLLASADGAAIEFFGLIPKPNERSSFDIDILPYIEIMQSNPKKLFLVFARGKLNYTDYQKNYLWQRYLYSCYLLSAGNNTYFKYIDTFRVPTLGGRSGGIDYYADWNIKLGTPLGNYQQINGLYLRQFENGLIAVAPHDGNGGKYSIPKTMYDPEGKQYSGTIDVLPGTGLILLNLRNKANSEFSQNFESSENLLQSWKGASIEREKERNNKFLKLQFTRNEREHDLLLDPVRELNTSTQLNFKVRSKDREAKVIAIAEIDDPNNEFTRFGLYLSSQEEYKKLNFAPQVEFKMQPYPGSKMPMAPIRLQLGDIGKWNQINLNPSDVNRYGYKFKRWLFIRFVGNLDLDDVAVHRLPSNKF